MAQAPRAPGSGAPPGPTPSPGDLTNVLRSRGYHVLLLAAALIGVPIAFIAFGFLAAVTAMEKWVWYLLPTNFGWDEPKPWYAVLVLVLAGALVGVGPEAPLIALGGGLALLAANRTKLRESPQGATPVAVAGSAAAIATIFGNPLVAAVLMLEVVGFAGRQVLLILLPCVASSGIGALIFTGLGSWSRPPSRLWRSPVCRPPPWTSGTCSG